MCLNLLDCLVLTGKLTVPGCGFAPLAKENNDQGAVEMGAVAEFLPGALAVADGPARERIAAVWREELPSTPGATLTEMIERARTGALKALFVVGENPVGTLPAHTAVAQSFAKLDLLVCQELFLTKTARLAHVVFPAASYMEKAGTFTNTEGHVQAVRPAIDPVGESRPDWEIVSALSVLMGMPLEYGDAKELLKEIRSVIPGYGQLGPAPIPPKVDQVTLERYLAEDYRQNLSARYTLTPGIGRPDGTVQVGLTQSLFHAGKLSTRSKGLLQVEGSGSLRMNPADAARFAVADGDRVRLSNALGNVTTFVKVWDRVPEGLAWFPDHFAEEMTRLFECTVDQETKVPSFRLASVSVMKVA
jgi:formate dehydrogenase alpha subunit